MSETVEADNLPWTNLSQAFGFKCFKKKSDNDLQKNYANQKPEKMFYKKCIDINHYNVAWHSG